MFLFTSVQSMVTCMYLGHDFFKIIVTNWKDEQADERHTQLKDRAFPILNKTCLLPFPPLDT